MEASILPSCLLRFLRSGTSRAEDRTSSTFDVVAEQVLMANNEGGGHATSKSLEKFNGGQPCDHWATKFRANLAISGKQACLDLLKQVEAEAAAGLEGVRAKWAGRVVEEQENAVHLYHMLILQTESEPFERVLTGGGDEQDGCAAWAALLQEYGRKTPTAALLDYHQFSWRNHPDPERAVQAWAETVRRLSAHGVVIPEALQKLNVIHGMDELNRPDLSVSFKRRLDSVTLADMLKEIASTVLAEKSAGAADGVQAVSGYGGKGGGGSGYAGKYGGKGARDDRGKASKGSGGSGKGHNSSTKGQSKGKGECYRCGFKDHQAKECPHRSKSCNKCGKEGHLARVCRSTEQAGTKAQR